VSPKRKRSVARRIGEQTERRRLHLASMSHDIALAVGPDDAGYSQDFSEG
jgi:hypothetical protein